MDPGNGAASNRSRKKVSGAAWGRDLKFREDTVSGGDG
jgi:hypothetical protein